MKKQLLIALFMVFLLHAKAQELNVRIDAGYGFNLTPATATSQHLIRGSESDRTTYKNTLYSYGQGWNANAELEYFWGKHFGTGLVSWSHGRSWRVLPAVSAVQPQR